MRLKMVPDASFMMSGRTAHAIGFRLFSGVHVKLAKNKNFVTRPGRSLGKEQPEHVQARS